MEEMGASTKAKEMSLRYLLQELYDAVDSLPQVLDGKWGESVETNGLIHSRGTLETELDELRGGIIGATVKLREIRDRLLKTMDRL